MATNPRRALAQQIGSLSSIEHHEIYKILTTRGIACTHNNNGAFVNLSTLPEEVVHDIQRFTEFCLANKQKLDEYERKISECKIYNDYSNLITRGGEEGNRPEDDDATASHHQQHGDVPADDWNGIIRSVAKTDRQKEHVSKYIDVLVRNQQQVDKGLVRKTASHNKFAAAKKRYGRRAARSTDHHDLPDCLEADIEQT